MSDQEDHIQYLFAAELQFRLASAVRLAVNGKRQPLALPMEWSHGRHVVHYEEIALRQDQADYAAFLVHRSATLAMAVAIKDAIEVLVPNLPKIVKKTNADVDGAIREAIRTIAIKGWKASDDDVATAYHVSGLIRNAYSHAPFAPVWKIQPDLQNKVFTIADVFELRTTGLEGRPFDWRHYGGPLALFHLCRFVRTRVLNHEPAPRKVVPLPDRRIYQQGDRIFEKIDEIAPDAKPVDMQNRSDGGIDLGDGHVAYPDKD
jgi:hypothetical protein